MNEEYEIIGSRSITGYSGTDFHEFRLRDDESCLLLGYDDRVVDMSAIVPGGQPNATVRGALIQEKDPSGNIVWQWSSWGHIDILDCDTTHIDLTGQFIDYVHTNAIEEDDDGNILISSRNLHEITKISRSNGNIIWRMGGKNNEFEFIGDDTLGFSGQHHIRKLDNGNYLLFDNGWYHPQVVSSALELELDEVNKTALVVNRYRSQPNDILGWIMGSSQRLPGGNTLVGWGSGVPNVTEFKADGSKALEFEFESVSYRAFKFQWETDIFSSNTQSLDFGEIYYPSSLTKSITVTNHKSYNIHITGIHNHTSRYYFVNELPLLIEGGSSAEVELRFVPVEIGEYDDRITLFAEKEGQNAVSAFALQLEVTGSASQEASVKEQDLMQLRIYPNPAHQYINISKEEITGELKYLLNNTMGQNVLKGMIPASAINYQISIAHLEAGIYIFVCNETKTGKSINRKIIIR
jgi:hypothetical protein